MRKLIILFALTLALTGCVPQSSVEVMLGEENMKIVKMNNMTLDENACVNRFDKNKAQMSLRQAMALALSDGCLRGKTLYDSQHSINCSIESGEWSFMLAVEELGVGSNCTVDVVTKKVKTNYIGPHIGDQVPDQGIAQ